MALGHTESKKMTAKTGITAIIMIVIIFLFNDNLRIEKGIFITDLFSYGFAGDSQQF